MFSIVTFTKGERPELLQKCIDSVQRCKPSGSVHHVLEVHEDWVGARVRALELGDVVAFVDDDDTVVNNSLSVCYEALQQTGAGLVFTDEAQVDLDGNVLQVRDGPRWYAEVKQRPWRIHHLSLIRTSAVVGDFSKFSQSTKQRDWLIRTFALNHSGAVHVPIIGYNWLRHPGQMSEKRSPGHPPFGATRYGRIPAWSIEQARLSEEL